VACGRTAGARMSRQRPVPLLEVSSVPCRVIERLNRFVVRVELQGGASLAHLNNTGRLLDYLRPGASAYCSPRTAPGRTGYRLIAFADGEAAALVDTSLQMRAFEAALAEDLIPWAPACSIARRSPRLGGSVLDYLLECAHPPGLAYVEVKSAVLRGPGGAAMYPDCPTERGRRQLLEMIRHSRSARMIVAFIAALPGAAAFRPNALGDPVMPELLARAASAGVEIRALSMHYDGRRILLDDPDLPVELQRLGASPARKSLSRALPPAPWSGSLWSAWSPAPRTGSPSR